MSLYPDYKDIVTILLLNAKLHVETEIKVNISYF